MSRNSENNHRLVKFHRLVYLHIKENRMSILCLFFKKNILNRLDEKKWNFQFYYSSQIFMISSCDELGMKFLLVVSLTYFAGAIFYIHVNVNFMYRATWL